MNSTGEIFHHRHYQIFGSAADCSKTVFNFKIAHIIIAVLTVAPLIAGENIRAKQYFKSVGQVVIDARAY